MIELRDDPNTNVLEFTVDGSIGEAEFDDVVARMRQKIQAHGSVRVLEHVRALGSFPMSRLWEDVKFAMRHRKDVSHAAVVGDQRWLRPLTRVARVFVDGEVRHFPERKMEEARAWLRHDIAGMPTPAM